VRDQNGLSLFKYSSAKDLYAANGTEIKKIVIVIKFCSMILESSAKYLQVVA
jgi:hypothetical protein